MRGRVGGRVGIRVELRVRIRFRVRVGVRVGVGVEVMFGFGLWLGVVGARTDGALQCGGAVRAGVVRAGHVVPCLALAPSLGHRCGGAVGGARPMRAEKRRHA